MLFLTALLTGFFGSFHCAGMCGPIAFALPGKKQEGALFYIGRLVYNFGRILTYASLGILSGAFGLGMKLAGFQQSISIGIGCIIIASVVFNHMRVGGISFNPLKFFSSELVQKLFKSKSILALFFIGLINGLLPCGFVYIALLGASATQGVWEGALFMALFGLGTLPFMFGVSILGQFLSSNVRSKISKLSPFLAILIALVFIVRGLNLGIPYLSPKIQTEQSEIKDCH
ncbi:MAG: hypothetical protein CFE21_02080 [Bacteroidetes bacterium B1(2017)]|nr:MAG: hypothetical protein CFE21_02080 [Bacteroidetes bacterium B1(2017)]